jgi:hypothetical protein
MRGVTKAGVGAVAALGVVGAGLERGGGAFERAAGMFERGGGVLQGTSGVLAREAGSLGSVEPRFGDLGSIPRPFQPMTFPRLGDSLAASHPLPDRLSEVPASLRCTAPGVAFGYYVNPQTGVMSFGACRVGDQLWGRQASGTVRFLKP